MPYVLVFAGDDWEKLQENPILVKANSKDHPNLYVKYNFCHKSDYRFCQIGAVFDNDESIKEETIVGLYTLNCPTYTDQTFSEEQSVEDVKKTAEIIKQDSDPECDVQVKAYRTSRLAYEIALTLHVMYPKRYGRFEDALKVAEELVKNPVQR